MNSMNTLFTRSVSHVLMVLKSFSRNHSGNPTHKFEKEMKKFTMVVNPIIGKNEWVEKPTYYDFFQEIARSSYADMLHDHERNEKYHVAIKKAVKSIRDQGRQVKVLDIGTGTGLLSMMAARAGADSIVACEMFTPVANCAKSVIKENGFEDKIKVVMKHSTDLTVGPDGDLKEKANILVAEVFDTELIGEGALKTFQHALKYLLEPESIVVPSAATVYAQIISSPMISKWNTLAPVQVTAEKVIHPPKNVVSCPGSAAVHDVQMTHIPASSFTAITEPITVFQFSFIGEKSIEMNETFIKQIPAINEGNCEIVFMWWTLKMDMDGEVVLNNGPKWVQPCPDKYQWRDHWMQAIYYLPDVLTVSKGDKITLTAYHDEYSLWFAIPKASNKKIVESPTCSCLAHVADSHTRIGMKNDTDRNKKYIEILEKVISPSCVCLSVSDGSLLPLIAAKLGAKKVFTVESSHFHQNMIKSYVEENNETNVIKIISKEPADLTEVDLEKEKINVLIAEPFFVNSVQPWELMRFWHLRTLLDPLLDSDVTVLPQVGTLKAVGVEFEDLWKIRAPVKNAEGFDLGKFDEMIQRAISYTDAVIEPHPLWEYPCKPVTEAFELIQFDFSKSTFTEQFDVSSQVSISCEGTCNGIAVWTEFSSNGTTISTGPTLPLIPHSNIQWYMNSKQGVYFLNPPTSVSPEKHVLNFKMNFNVTDSTFNFKVEER